MVSFLILADGTIVYDEYCTPARWSRVMLAHTTMIAWCSLFSYFISEHRRGGLWACPQLSSYSWWGCEYNMNRLLTKLYLQLFWEKLMYVSYTTDWPGSSVGHPTGALAKICLWVIQHGWLTLYGMRCQDDIFPGEFWLLQCACLLDWALQLMYVHNQFLIVISSSGMLAMLGMGAGPSKLW
jgi:hypothetical protein